MKENPRRNVGLSYPAEALPSSGIELPLLVFERLIAIIVYVITIIKFIDTVQRL